MTEKLETKVVKDPAATRTKATQISVEATDLILERIMKFECEDDPVEFIYLAVHTLSCILANICMNFENFGKEIFGMEKLNREDMFMHICNFTESYFNSNSEIKEISKLKQ